MSFLARLQIMTGRSKIGRASAASSIAKARNSGWFALLPWPMAMLGESQLGTGEIRAASETFGEAYALAREIDDPCWLAVSLRGMALVAQREGDTIKAIGLLQDGLRVMFERSHAGGVLMIGDIEGGEPVGSCPLFERCGIETDRCGTRRCPLEWPSRSGRRCT